jgi:hypothetical protein
MGRAPHHGMTRNGGAGDPLAERVGESGRVPPNVRGRRSRHATRHYSPSTSTSRSRRAGTAPLPSRQAHGRAGRGR